MEIGKKEVSIQIPAGARQHNRGDLGFQIGKNLCKFRQFNSMFPEMKYICFSLQADCSLRQETGLQVALRLPGGSPEARQCEV